MSKSDSHEHLGDLPLGGGYEIPKNPNGSRNLEKFIAENERGSDKVTLLDLGRSPAFVAEVPMDQLENAINVLRGHGILAYPSGDNTIAGYINSPEQQQFLTQKTEFVVFGLPGPTSYSRLRVDRGDTAHLTSFGLIAAYRAFHTQVHNSDRKKWHGKAFLMPIDEADQLQQLAEIYPDDVNSTVNNDKKKDLTEAVKQTKLMEYALDGTYFDRFSLANAFDEVPPQEFQPLKGKEVKLNHPVVYKIDIDEFSKTLRSLFSTNKDVSYRNEYNPEIYLEIVAQYFNALENHLVQQAAMGVIGPNRTNIPLHIYFSQRLGDAIYVYATPQDASKNTDNNRKLVADFLEQAIDSFSKSKTGHQLSFKYIPMNSDKDTIHATVAGHRLLRSDDTYPADTVSQREEQFKATQQESFITNAQYTLFLIQEYGKLTPEQKAAMDPSLVDKTAPNAQLQRDAREKLYRKFTASVKDAFSNPLTRRTPTPRD